MAHRYRWFDDGFIVRLYGVLSIEELKRINKKWKAPEKAPNIKWQIWDFSEADLKNMFESDAQDPHGTLLVPNMQLILISADPHSQKLLEAYVSRSIQRGSTWDFQIVETMQQAEAQISGLL